MAAATIRPPAIHLSIETPATPEDAWEALTDPDRVAEWFTDASPVGAPGDEYRLDFGDSAVAGSIVEVDHGRRFSHTWLWEGAEPEDETLVTWTVEPISDDGSRVILEHGGWPETTPDDT
jgi:uncharacterized protein YndB with AHSA1/START domain